MRALFSPSAVRRRLGSAQRRARRHLRQALLFGVATRDVLKPLPTASPETLDVTIPLGPGDKEMLAVCVSALRRNLRHPISSVRVVCPADLVTAAKVPGVDAVIDERDVVASDVLELIRSRGRGGWVVQQLVKLSVDLVEPARPTLCLDADTLLVSPQVFTSDDAVVRLVVTEYRPEYHDHLRRVLGPETRPAHLGFVAHHMVFEPAVLQQLRRRIADVAGGRRWDLALIESIDDGARSRGGMSEFELYGHFNHRHRDRPLRYAAFFNRPAMRSDLISVEDAEHRWGERFRTVSFHGWLEPDDVETHLRTASWHERDRRLQRVAL